MFALELYNFRGVRDHLLQGCAMWNFHRALERILSIAAGWLGILRSHLAGAWASI